MKTKTETENKTETETKTVIKLKVKVKLKTIERGKLSRQDKSFTIINHFSTSSVDAPGTCKI